MTRHFLCKNLGSQNVKEEMNELYYVGQAQEESKLCVIQVDRNSIAIKQVPQKA